MRTFIAEIKFKRRKKMRRKLKSVEVIIPALTEEKANRKAEKIADAIHNNWIIRVSEFA